MTMIYWLVVSDIVYFPFHIWDVILPIDELHDFSSWLSHHQPVDMGILVHQAQSNKRLLGFSDLWYPLVNKHNYGKSPFSMGKLIRNDHFQ